LKNYFNKLQFTKLFLIYFYCFVVFEIWACAIRPYGRYTVVL